MNKHIMHHLVYRCFLIAALLLLPGCSINTVKEFYSLSYQPNVERPSNQSTKMQYPLPYRLEIGDFDINRIYDRNAIVIRQSLHKMVFDEKQLWAYRPHKSATELLISHVNASGLFAECRNEFMDSYADYYITGRINNIERYQNLLMNFAYLDFDISFLDKNKKVLITRHIRRDIKLEGENTAFFVKSLSDVFKEEFSGFINSIFLYFENSKQ